MYILQKRIWKLSHVPVKSLNTYALNIAYYIQTYKLHEIFWYHAFRLIHAAWNTTIMHQRDGQLAKKWVSEEAAVRRGELNKTEILNDNVTKNDLRFVSQISNFLQFNKRFLWYKIFIKSFNVFNSPVLKHTQAHLNAWFKFHFQF